MVLNSFLIVVPTFNSYSQLSSLVTSLTLQSYKNWRVLFVDGPSTHEHRAWLTQCCESDRRFTMVIEDPDSSGIYNAMSLGFNYLKPGEWVLFWGSDDCAFDESVFEKLNSHIGSSASVSPDLIIGKASYIDLLTDRILRVSSFGPAGLLDHFQFRKRLFSGFSPPHQASIFGPRISSLLKSYSPRFLLAADLHYFLTISGLPSIQTKVVDDNLVLLGHGGISNQKPILRLREVLSIYISFFSGLFMIPFLLRYLRRITAAYLQ